VHERQGQAPEDDRSSGVYLDLDRKGRLVALELLDASVHIPRAALEKLPAPSTPMTLEALKQEFDVSANTWRRCSAMAACRGSCAAPLGLSSWRAQQYGRRRCKRVVLARAFLKNIFRAFETKHSEHLAWRAEGADLEDHTRTAPRGAERRQAMGHWSAEMQRHRRNECVDCHINPRD
jgi:hypothetical protein